MRANPTALAPATIQNQGVLLGEIIADRVSKGQPVTEILTHILSFGPISLREAVFAARFMPPVAPIRVEPHTLRDDNTPFTWSPTRVRRRDRCVICNGTHEPDLYPDPPENPSRF